MDPILINGINVPITWSYEVSDKVKEAVYSSKKFKDFINAIDNQIMVSSIDIQSVDMFGPNVGFIKLKAQATRHGKRIPSIAFIRGHSVAVYVKIINKDNRNESWVLMTQQARFPIGKGEYIEICAGMLDESGDFRGKCAEEIEEELGIKINISDLIPLYPATEGVKDNRALVLSGGGCDEKMQLFKIEIEMSKEEIDALDGKLTGLVDSSEHIIMRLIPTDKFTTVIDDMKSVLAHYLSSNIIVGNPKYDIIIGNPPYSSNN
jgi:ADP-sugar diphosphatase